MTSSPHEPPVSAQPHPRRIARPSRLVLGPQIFIKKGIAPFDLRDPYYFAVSLSWRKFGLLFVVTELVVNLVFATLYWLQPGSVANVGTPRFLGAFFFSLETLATVGYGEMYPATTFAHVVSSLEIVTGVVITAIITGLLFVRFSKPKAKIRYAAKAVVTRHNGKPTLMLRIGNARSSILHDACFTLHILSRSVSTEGMQHAGVTELPLTRPRLPIFAILYTAMHVLDENSPISGFGGGSEDEDPRFFLTIKARDPAIGQEVTDVHMFEGKDILFGMRYVDAIKAVGTSKVVADYTLLSELAPDGPFLEEAAEAALEEQADA